MICLNLQGISKLLDCADYLLLAHVNDGHDSVAVSYHATTNYPIVITMFKLG